MEFLKLGERRGLTNALEGDEEEEGEGKKDGITTPKGGPGMTDCAAGKQNRPLFWGGAKLRLKTFSA